MDLFRLLLTLPSADDDGDGNGDAQEREACFVWLSKSDQKTSRVLWELAFSRSDVVVGRRQSSSCESEITIQ